MLVQVFLVSAERGDMDEVGRGVWTQAEAGGEACHVPFPHTRPSAPAHPTALL